AATTPANYTFTVGDAGAKTFSVTLKTVGNQTVTATDTVTSSITGTSDNIAVSAGTATHLSVSAPSSATAGSPVNVTVTAQDQFNNTATGYTGTVHFTSTDGVAVLPADYTFTGGDAGVQTFSVTLKTVGNRTVTATDTGNNSITGVSGTIAVTAASADHLVVSAPASAPAGSAFSITVTAQDAFNNTATSYTGTVTFSSSDVAVGRVLPADYTFVAGDNGVHTFPN